MNLESTDVVWPWILSMLLFLVLLGTGRTLRGGLFGHAPFGAGVALSAALGVWVYSMLWMGLGHFGALHAPWPWAVFALGALLALPGLFWTVRDYGTLAPGLERGVGPPWFAGGAWFLLIAAIAISFFWISGVTSYGGIGFLFERAGLDHAVGSTFYDEGFPRDPFLGAEPLALWLFGLGAPMAALMLSWWLGIAMLFGVCGLGWRLHGHGAGLAAAAVFAVVLFATDRPLFLAPALPAALAMIAVLVLLVESRGRPRPVYSLLAGLLGGFALISDLGVLAMLLPLLFLGPLWCKWAVDLPTQEAVPADRDRVVDELDSIRGEETDRVVDELDSLRAGEALDPVPGGVGKKKWLTPVRHTALGLAGLTLPLAPWMARNEAWVGDPCYGFGPDFAVESDYRFYDLDPVEPGFQAPPRLGREGIDWGERGVPGQPRTQYEPIFLDYDVGFGPDWMDELGGLRDYTDAVEWGIPVILAALWAPYTSGRRRRRERLVQLGTGLAGYGAGAVLGDCETTTPSAIGLVSVSAGMALYDMIECRPALRNFSMGGTLATGGLALGLSTANDCGYWPSWGDYPSFPQFHFVDDLDPGETPEIRLDLRYDWYRELEVPSEEPADEEAGFDYGAGLKYDYGRGLELRGGFRDPDADEPETGTTPQPDGAKLPSELPTVPDRGPGDVPRGVKTVPFQKPSIDPGLRIPNQGKPQQYPGGKPSLPLQQQNPSKPNVPLQPQRGMPSGKSYPGRK